MAAPPKKNKGRQKVNMLRMEKDSNRQVTFSKRRSGLFKKASELCTLCGAEIAIIVFSAGQKPFSFGHPSVESIIKRFLSSNPSSPNSITEPSFTEAHRNAGVNDLNMNLTMLNYQIENEKKRGDEINNMKAAKKNLQWWARPVEELSYEQVVHLKASLEELMKNVNEYGNKLMMIEGSNNGASQIPIMGANSSMLGFYGDAMSNPNGGFVGYPEGYY